MIAVVELVDGGTVVWAEAAWATSATEYARKMLRRRGGDHAVVSFFHWTGGGSYRRTQAEVRA